MRRIDDYRFSKAGLICFCVMMAATNVFHVLSFMDRRQLRQSEVMTRQMLDARAKVQTTYFNALRRQGILTPEEQDQITANWKDAEYDTGETK